MEKSYRKNYKGENCVYKRTQHNGVITEKREWIPTTIHDFSHSGNAVVIGNGLSRKEMPLYIIETHRGGHQGKRKLVSYGCNGLCRDMTPNFLVVTNDGIADEVHSSGYTKDNIVLAHPEVLLRYPKEFHLIPYDRYWNAGATATWLACFDGQKKIYLLGFDNQPVVSKNLNVYAGTNGYEDHDALVQDTQWINAMYEIFTTYDDVEFVWVNPTAMPESWKYVSNLRQVTMRQFAIEADLGA